MVTELRRYVLRRTVEAHDYRRRKLVICLEPGDVISLREERCRKWFSAPLSKVYHQIVRWNLESAKQAKRNQRNPN